MPTVKVVNGESTLAGDVTDEEYAALLESGWTPDKEDAPE